MLNGFHNGVEYILADGGLPEVASFLASTSPNWPHPYERNRTSTGRSWVEFVTVDEAMAMARHGWQAGADMVQRGLADNFAHTERANKRRWDVAGEQVCVGRYLSGVPAHMQRRGRDHTPKPTLGLFVPNGINSSILAAQLQNFGLAFAAKVDALEDAGTRVELWAGSYAIGMRGMRGGANKAGFIGWRVKHADEPLDMAAIAFSLAHPAAHRIIGFSMRQRLAGVQDMGASRQLTPGLLPPPIAHLVPVGGLGGVQDKCTTYASAVKFVQEQVEGARNGTE